MKALLLEDDELRGRALQRKLKSRGYEVDWCTAVIEAIEWLVINQRQYELASLDYDLGGGPTGLDLARQIAIMAIEARPARVEIHSSDDAGAMAMLAVLTAAGVPAERKEAGQ